MSDRRRRLPRALLALPLLAAALLVLHWPARSVGVLSDGWDLLEIGSRPLSEAVTTGLQSHAIPVTHLLNAVLWRAIGLREPLYQVLNLIELGGVAWLLFLIALQLFGRPLVAAIASLVFLANSSFCEVTLWPVVGNFQSLTAALYLAGVMAAVAAARSVRPWPWAAGFTAASLLACLTYEPAVTMLPVGIVAGLLMGSRAPLNGSPKHPALREALPLAVAAIISALAIVAVRTALMDGVEQSAFPPTDFGALRQRLFFLVRAVLSVLSLRSADGPLYELITMGTGAVPGGHVEILLLVWLASFAAGAVVLMQPRRSPPVRFLAAWFSIHLAVLGAGTNPVSRHLLLLALPASLLSAWLLIRATELATGYLVTLRGASGPGMAAAPIAAAVIGVLGIWGAQVDYRRFAALYREATAATHQVQDSLLAALASEPPPTRVALVNMPAGLASDGVRAHAFANGLRPMSKLTTGGRLGHHDVELYRTHGRDRLALLANQPGLINLSDLHELARDPNYLVLAFDSGTHSVVTLGNEWSEPEVYASDTSSYLAWLDGEPPHLAVHPGEILELPLAKASCVQTCGVAVDYRAEAGRQFVLRAAGLEWTSGETLPAVGEWRRLEVVVQSPPIVTIESVGEQPALLQRLEVHPRPRAAR